MIKLLFDKVENKVDDRMFFIDNSGELWIDNEPNAVQLNGDVKIKHIPKDHFRFTLIRKNPPKKKDGA